MMDQVGFTVAPQHTYKIELYTARFFIEGEISAAFKRMSDMLNRREGGNYLTVNGASVSSIGQQGEPRKFETPISVHRSHIHFASSPPEAPDTAEAAAEGTQTDQRGLSVGREFYVQKKPFPCYALTDTFVIHGLCYLNEGVTLQHLLERPDQLFIPITEATIYLVARPNISWKRDLAIVNKDNIEVIYLTE